MITFTRNAKTERRTPAGPVPATWPFPKPDMANPTDARHTHHVPQSERSMAGPVRPDWAPPLRGSDLASLVRWAIACRASAGVLDLEGQPERAAHLRQLAETADRRSDRLVAASAASLLVELHPAAA